MKFAVSLACIKMRLMPAEALNAATINSAYAMGLSEDYGSITVGKVANFYITDPIPSIDFILTLTRRQLFAKYSLMAKNMRYKLIRIPLLTN